MPFPQSSLILRSSRSILKGLNGLSLQDKCPAALSVCHFEILFSNKNIEHRCVNITYIIYVYFQQIVRCKVTVTAYPSQITGPPVIRDKNAKVSQAMKAYLERSREHEAFMKAQTTEYEIGKRHLANMMGEDPETFTQEDVNVSDSTLISVDMRVLMNIFVPTERD